MNLMTYWKSANTEIEIGLSRWLPMLCQDLPEMSPETMRQPLAGGKRIRGCLVCLMSEALGGTLEAAIPRAVAIECIQAASLIHDDIVDGDRMRRSQPATWTVEGMRKAVLLGDVIFSTAIERLAELGPRDTQTLAHAIATLAKGAYQEAIDPVVLRSALLEGRYQPAIYEQIIRLKTGALFAAAAQLGALAAEASDEMAARAFAFGMRLGEAYQIADDLDDLAAWPDQQAIAAVPLLPTLLYFSDKAPSPISMLDLFDGGDAWHSEMALQLPGIMARMQVAIIARTNSALAELQGLPDNPHLKLLRSLPRQILPAVQSPGTSFSQASLQ